MELLKPCPFCGNAAQGENDYFPLRIKTGVYDICGIGVRKEVYFAVKCNRCGAQGGMGLTGQRPNGTNVTEQEARQIAINKWNKRGE